MHDLLPRAWRKAFGEWHIDRAPSDSDDFHTQIRSKIYRAKLWLSHESTTWKSMVLSLCSGPVDQLLQRLQFIDAQGGGYKDLYDGTTNVFCKTMRQIADLFMDESPEAQLLTSQYENAGPVVVSLVMQNALATCLGLASRVWLHLYSLYDTWPYKLVALVGPPSCSVVATEFCAASLCCLDRDFSQKVPTRMGFAPFRLDCSEYRELK